jgi:hypothetical protein
VIQTRRATVCGVCSGPLEGLRADAAYCGTPCRKVASKRRITASRRVARICPGCEQTFMPHHGQQVYCTNACSQWFRRGKRVRAPAATECERCGQAFSGRRLNARFCRKPCQMAAANMRRRAREAGAATDEPIANIALLYERDEGVCGLCDEPVDRAVEWPDPASLSLDHVVPLALGGRHATENLQIAHLVCNLRKGHRVAAASEVSDGLE